MVDGVRKVALVTGGSRGIGRAISVELASRGCHVFVNYSSNAILAEETVAECVKVGGTAEVLGFDVASSESVENAVNQIKEKCGRLDILVNNAGISKDGLFVRMKDEDWMTTIQVNLSGAFYCSRAAGRLMMKARWGRIINISSVVGEMGNGGQVPYAASKAGLFGLTKSIAKELASRNVTVNCITPGFIETDMTNALDDKTKDELLKGIPSGRYGSAVEVAKLVGFLVSDDAAYITGQVVGINGGIYM